MEIGQLLKEERKAQQLSLDEIQEMTKIQKRYLQAIEDNNFDSLPGRFYARAFIKEYALVLNMDEDLLLQNFDGGEVEEEEQTQYTNVRRSRRPRAPKSSTVLSFLPTVIVIVLIIAVLFIAWMLTQKALTSNSSDPTQPTESDEIIRDVEQGEKEQPASEDEEEEEEDDKDSEKEEESQFESQFEVDDIGSGTSPQSELTFSFDEEELLLSFDVEAEAYVSIVGESNKSYFDGILEPNSDMEPIDLTEESNVYLNIGNTTGVTVKLNDIAMDYPISPSEKVHQKFLINLTKQDTN